MMVSSTDKHTQNAMAIEGNDSGPSDLVAVRGDDCVPVERLSPSRDSFAGQESNLARDDGPLQESQEMDTILAVNSPTYGYVPSKPKRQGSNDLGAPTVDPEASGGQVSNSPTIQLPRFLMLSLYTSHCLSTWNSRLFEMGAVLFLAAIFPDTLLPMSVYALVRSGAAIVFSPAVGSFIDRGNRLSVVQISIVGQRIAVVASCAIFWALEQRHNDEKTLKMGLFALATVLACVEKLCAVMNLVSVERDWVVVITNNDEPLRHLVNARMRRIDLFCKLLGPLAISLIDGASTLIAIWVTLGTSTASVLIEYICISRVYKMVPALGRSSVSLEFEAGPENLNTSTAGYLSNVRNLCSRILSSTRQSVTRLLPLQYFPFYFRHPVFLPSISLALLYFTVLSFSGQMITFLLSAGYTSVNVGIARTISTIFELSATWIAPRVMKRIGPIRGGIWFLSWQMIWISAGVSWFIAEDERQGGPTVLAASALVGGVILSRVGLWGFDLCAQTLIQDGVESDHRGAFSTVEASFQNLFELLSYVTTIIFSRPAQFKWPSVISVGAVYAAGGLYTIFVRRRRGHLIHPPPCLRPKFDVDDLELE